MEHRTLLVDGEEIEYILDGVDAEKLGAKGGSGSGNWGHAGRPGLVGGSGGGAGGVAKPTGPTPISSADIAWIESLTSDERKAVDGYLHIGPVWAGSSHINTVLRQGIKPDAKTARNIELLDDVLAKAPKLDEDTVFYRSLPVGASISDGGYVSAMRQSEYASIYATRGRELVSFEVAKGTPVAAISSMHLPYSEEVLLPRDINVRIVSRTAAKELGAKGGPGSGND